MCGRAGRQHGRCRRAVRRDGTCGRQTDVKIFLFFFSLFF